MTSLATLKEVKRENDRVIKFIKPQDGFVFTEARFPAFVAAWGTGKTMCGIARGMRLSESYPNNLGVIFRKEYTDLRDSTIKDFENYTNLKIDSHRDVVLENGSIIMFRHMEEMNILQNTNLGWFMIEQAEELDTDDQFFKLFGRLRRKDVPHFGFIIANTNGHNWIYKLWKMGQLEGGELFEGTTYDNLHNLPEDFIKSLDVLKKEKPTVYNRFVLNSWDEADTSDNVIPPAWVDAAVKRFYAPDGDTTLGVDVARYGDDDTVILPIKGRRAFPPIVIHGHDTMQVAGQVAVLADQMKATKIMIDTIGIGAGVYDRLKELKYPVYEVNVAMASTVLDNKTQKPKFKNLRSELWWKARESIDPDPAFQSSPFVLPNDPILREQLITPKYVINSSGQIEIESKDDMKERLGRSPDVADAYCLAVHGILTDARPWGFFGIGTGSNRTQQVANWM